MSLELLILIIFIIDNSTYGNAKLCDSILPVGAQKEIARNYKGWRIIKKEDLVFDDQTLWDKSHQEECPGISAGRYDKAAGIEYAILVFREISEKKHTKLLLLKSDTSGIYHSTVLYFENDVTNLPVIYRRPAGKYSDFYNDKKSIVTKSDVIVYEHIEASAIVFYNKNGKYRQILISD